MTYEQMKQELDQIPMFGKAAGLENLSAYLQYLNHPEDSLRVIHVAGTNGKGSVSSYIEACLRINGYSTGLFTSPHLIRINERIRINFAECSDQEMADAYAAVKKVLDQRETLSLKMLTYFEVLFLMGMLIFSWHKPDYCIVETGLGGRLDATVLTKPILSVITSISLDHTAILGDSMEAIAREKAGIIKKGVPVVVMKENESAFAEIAAVAKSVRAPLYEVQVSDALILKKNMNYIDFSMQNRYYKNGMLRIHSMAVYQIYNAMLAALALHILQPSFTEEKLAEGIAAMKWEGRMEEIMPGIYVDGAHNPGAMEQIRMTMAEQQEKWNLLFAVCQDKDYHSMIEILGRISWKSITVTHFLNDRAADISDIANEFRKHSNCPVTVSEHIEEALQKALQENRTPLLCLGSLYLVSEIKSYCKWMAESEEK